MSIPVLRLAVCLFPGVAALDYQGSVEFISCISPRILASFSGQYFTSPPKYTIDITYLAYTLDAVEPFGGPRLLPSSTYAAAKDDHFDIFFVPGGPGAQPDAVRAPLLEFIQAQAPKVKYIISVCTGSWILAQAGILNGKRATTNKSSLKQIEAATQGLNITWVRKARWVVDSYDGVENKLWTSSGVTAGMDLTNAFLEHILESKEQVEVARGIIELTASEQGDDPFAAFWDLDSE